ncbi:MAG: hypothetical protein IKB08_05280 [Clostridia bacterium]|nr:hypothetical protein [Clostridia bacterium]
MTKFKKIIVAVMVSLMLILPLGATASAADLIDPDNINGIAKYFGIDLSDPESIQNAIDEIREGGLSGIMNLFGIDIADILDTLEEYIGSMQVPTTKPQETTEPTTEEPVTEEPTTEEPATTPPPIYTPTYPTYPSYTPSYPATTLPPVETTTFQFIPPEQIYTEAYTTTVFSPIVEDNIDDIDSDVSPVKTALGVVLLLASGVGVIIVVLALKRNRI